MKLFNLIFLLCLVCFCSAQEAITNYKFEATKEATYGMPISSQAKIYALEFSQNNHLNYKLMFSSKSIRKVFNVAVVIKSNKVNAINLNLLLKQDYLEENLMLGTNFFLKKYYKETKDVNFEKATVYATENSIALLQNSIIDTFKSLIEESFNADEIRFLLRNYDPENVHKKNKVRKRFNNERLKIESKIKKLVNDKLKSI